MRRRFGLLCLLALAASLTLVACGGSDDAEADEEQIRSVAAAFLNAYADYAPQACELLSPAHLARIEVSPPAGGERATCAEVIELTDGEPLAADAIRTAADRIDEAAVTVDRDYAEVSLGAGKTSITGLVLVRSPEPYRPAAIGQDVEWRVDETVSGGP